MAATATTTVTKNPNLQRTQASDIGLQICLANTFLDVVVAVVVGAALVAAAVVVVAVVV